MAYISLELSSYKDDLNIALKKIKAASFVAVDLEFTGTYRRRLDTR